ncbi:Kazal-type serine protease inhibitor domain-containing protein [Ensifer adhaerens]|uniref:Kazal-type serine protease inhibitor family protein n=1 Tax=Ensifer adhaerens TaxID=106592 RepID=UPI0023A95BE3|nr:Kazal-type serine protease inhibitor domain-containing protein [Ensifer adhaerens]WDZ78558.1 Kazal-type serine protease inhibitor domain-containing protein [Ensifer adhaerens]
MALLKLLLTRPIAVLMLALGVLSACTVVVDEPRPGPRPIRPPVCTMEYAPVCGERGNRMRTFSNSCQARADGFNVIHRGECRPDNRPPVRPPQACTMEYMPVCGQRGRNTQTFPNACQARAEGFQVIGSGECRRGDDRPSEGQFCTREFAPVCGQRGGRMETFSNACEAGGAGFRIVHRGECR